MAEEKVFTLTTRLRMNDEIYGYLTEYITEYNRLYRRMWRILNSPEGRTAEQIKDFYKSENILRRTADTIKWSVMGRKRALYELKKYELGNIDARITKLKDDMTETLVNFCKQIKTYLEQLDKSEKNIIAENAEYIDKLSEQVDATVHELGATLDKNINRMSDSFTELIRITEQEQETQRKATSMHLEALTEQTGKSISEHITSSFESLSNLQNSCDANSRAGLEKLSQLVKDFSGVAQEKLDVANYQYCEMLETLRKELSERYDGLKACVGESLTKCVDSISSHNIELADSIANINRQHTNRLETKNSEAVFNASAQLAARNQEIMAEQTEQFRSEMEQISQRFDTVLLTHAKMLSEKTEESIKNFVASTDTVFGKNASITAELLATEHGFLNEYGLHNNEMNSMSEYRELFVNGAL